MVPGVSVHGKGSGEAIFAACHTQYLGISDRSMEFQSWSTGCRSVLQRSETVFMNHGTDVGRVETRINPEHQQRFTKPLAGSVAQINLRLQGRVASGLNVSEVEVVASAPNIY